MSWLKAFGIAFGIVAALTGVVVAIASYGPIAFVICAALGFIVFLTWLIHDVYKD